MKKIRRAITAAAVVAASVASVASAANLDIAGYWEAIESEDVGDRGGGPTPGDYTGLPLNDAARLRADTWTGAMLSMPDHQCIPHNAIYGTRTVGFARIWETVDLETQIITKINIGFLWSMREIWMDGRPHPPESAPHTWQGFSTGRWEGDVLVINTTHLKSSYLTRNGVMTSDKAVQEERLFLHDGIINHVGIVTDPVYLTEPLVRTTLYVQRPKTTDFAFPCRPTVEIPRERGAVPHNDFGFGDTAASVEFSRNFGVPLAAARGGAATALPEFMDSPAAKVPVEKEQPGAKKR